MSFATINQFAEHEKRIAALEARIAELESTRQSEAVKATRKGGKKAKAEPTGEPKEKKAPNEWIVFSGRVEQLVRAHEQASGAEKMKTVVVKQFASHLKSQKVYALWTDSEITAEIASFEPPAVSKQELAKSSKSSTGSAEAAEPVADAPNAGKKTRKPQSQETKDAAALKRAATKAAKAGKTTEAAPVVAAPVVAAPVVVAEAKQTKVKVAPKPKKVVDLLLDPWDFEGESYYKNSRNDVVSPDGDWVGRFNGSAIDTTIPEPEDFAELESR
jgi:hypothetical protein